MASKSAVKVVVVADGAGGKACLLDGACDGFGRGCYGGDLRWHLRWLGHG